MTVTPVMIIGGVNVSRYVEKIHAEMSANLSKDPGKYDVTLANISGKFFGAFQIASEDEEIEEGVPLDPKTEIILQIVNDRKACSNGGSTSNPETYQIFDGEVQNVNCDEIYCQIQGSCFQGGMSSLKQQHDIFVPGTDIITIVKKLLEEFGFTGIAHIFPRNNRVPDKSYELKGELDFSTAMDKVAGDGQSIYYFDEYGEFWFVPAFTLKGAQDLTGPVIMGSNAKSMVGHCNRIYVFGGVIPGIEPDQPLSEIKTHALVFAMAENQEDQESYGVMTAPWVYRPNCNQAECQRIADNLLEWYLQFKDVPQVKVSGRAPPLLSKVSYIPWNGNMPPTNCISNKPTTFGPVVGIVTRRVVDLDANGGFVCTLDIATGWQSLGDAWDLGIEEDPAVDYGDTVETNPLTEISDTYIELDQPGSWEGQIG